MIKKNEEEKKVLCQWPMPPCTPVAVMISIHKHAVRYPPPGSCLCAYEITIMHLAVAGDKHLATFEVCKREEYSGATGLRHPFRYHPQSPLILYTLFNFNGYLICVISLQGSK